jgi:hypothetical protein
VSSDLCVMTHRQDPERPRRAVDGLYLCIGHLRELRHLVAQMPARHEDLRRVHGPGGPRTSGGGGAGVGLSFDEPVAAHRSHMEAVLASWCRVVVEDRGVTAPPDTGIGETARWLARHVDWCAAHEWVADMLVELRQVSGRALHLADIPARRVQLGERCLTHAGGEPCTGTVTLIIIGDDWSAYCPVCDQVQDATPYLRVARSGRWITAEGAITLAHLFGIPCSENVLYQWRHRRRIVGRIVAGAVQYDLASVQRYLAQRQTMAERARLLGRSAQCQNR